MTCTTRCPKAVDCAGLMDALRQLSIEHGLASPAQRRTILFQQAFLDNFRRNGPLAELELVRKFKTQGFLDDLSLPQLFKDALLGPLVELDVRGTTRICNLIQIFQQVGCERIQAADVQRLEDFRPACYYGCLLTRPPGVVQFDDCEHPNSMESLLRTGKTITVGFGLVLRSANGVGSRFRATTNHMEHAFPENDSRPPCAKHDSYSFAGPKRIGRRAG
jgi:hypothetical protein